jgi:carbon monoxide dehydrogenase subunit G
MAEGSVTKEMTPGPDVVWAVVSDFYGLDKWIPGVTKCTKDGHDRLVHVGELVIRERLIELDNENRSLIYSIIEGSPASAHEAQITVDPHGQGSQVTYRVTVEPDEALEFYKQTYAGLLEALAHYAG